jgi:hypothetical protein
MSIEIVRQDELRLKINLYRGNIIHIHAGGLDGYQDSLLNRYRFIKQLEEPVTTANKDNCFESGDSYSLSINTDLAFLLKKDEELLFAKARDSVVKFSSV